MITPEQDRWGEALAIERVRGDSAAKSVAEQVAMFALSGDEAGVQHFREIAGCLDRLMKRSALH